MFRKIKTTTIIIIVIKNSNYVLITNGQTSGHNGSLRCFKLMFRNRKAILNNKRLE